MRDKTKERTSLALHNAAEFIRSHAEQGGIDPEDVNEESESGMSEYNKACYRASKLIEKLAKKYEK